MFIFWNRYYLEVKREAQDRPGWRVKDLLVTALD